MTATVKGHGSRLDDETTFVPVGTKLRFYSGLDVDISQNVELVAIANGAKATAQETIEGTGKKDDVSNYELGTINDEFVARWVAIGGTSGIPIYFVGASEIKDGARLCDSPDTCDGTHSCTGVLGTLKARRTSSSWPVEATSTPTLPSPSFGTARMSRTRSIRLKTTRTPMWRNSWLSPRATRRPPSRRWISFRKGRSPS